MSFARGRSAQPTDRILLMLQLSSGTECVPCSELCECTLYCCDMFMAARSLATSSDMRATDLGLLSVREKLAGYTAWYGSLKAAWFCFWSSPCLIWATGSWSRFAQDWISRFIWIEPFTFEEMLMMREPLLFTGGIWKFTWYVQWASTTRVYVGMVVTGVKYLTVKTHLPREIIWLSFLAVIWG